MRNPLVLFLLLSTSLWSQRITTSFSKASVFVGESFEIQYEMEISGKEKVVAKAFENSIYSLRASEDRKRVDTIYLDILEAFRDTIETIQGKKYWRAKYVAIAFDTGYLILPPTSIQVDQKVVEMEPALLRVNLMPKKDDIDIYDIQEHFTEIPEKPFNLSNWLKDNLYWLLPLIVLAITLFIRNRKKKRHLNEPQAEPEVILTARDKALEKLAQLEIKELWKNDQLKDHFIELSSIVRAFLSEEFDRAFFEKTTFEIQFILRQEGLNELFLTELSLILSSSDMVKFAKSKVEDEGVVQLNGRVRQFLKIVERKA
jgi:hypothetical protein